MKNCRVILQTVRETLFHNLGILIMLKNRRHRTTKHICILYPKRILQSQYIPYNNFSHRFDQSKNETQGEETIVKRKSTMSILISRNKRSKSMPSNIDEGGTIRRLIQNIIIIENILDESDFDNENSSQK